MELRVLKKENDAEEEEEEGYTTTTLQTKCRILFLDPNASTILLCMVRDVIEPICNEH